MKHSGNIHTDPALRQARCCYGHAAGQFACALCDALLARDYLRSDGKQFFPTHAGLSWFAALGIDTLTLRQGRAAFAPHCMDGSERRPHLGGSLGRALLAACVARGWVHPSPGSRRLQVSDAGWQVLRGLWQGEDDPIRSDGL